MEKRYAVLAAMILLSCSVGAMDQATVEQPSMEQLSMLTEEQVADLCARLEATVLSDVQLVDTVRSNSLTGLPDDAVAVEEGDIESGDAPPAYHNCSVCKELESLIAFVDRDVGFNVPFLTDNENFAHAVAVVLRCGPLGASSRLRQCVDDEAHGRLMRAIQVLTEKLSQKDHQRVLLNVEHYLQHHPELGPLPDGLAQLFARCDRPLQRRHDVAVVDGGVACIGAGYHERGVPVVDHHEPTDEEIARAAVQRTQHRAAAGMGRSLTEAQEPQEGRISCCCDCCLREWTDPETGEITEGCCCLGGKCCHRIDKWFCNANGDGLSCKGKWICTFMISGFVLVVLLAIVTWRSVART